jgi:2Fe-2S ferredoxin
MAVLNVVDREGEKSSIESDTGYSVMDILRDNGHDIAGICGGVCSCATCHVYVGPELMSKLDDRSADEQVLVESSEYYEEAKSRLCCQIEFTDALDGAEVTLAPED